MTKRDGIFMIVSRIISIMCFIFCARCAYMQANVAGYFAGTVMAVGCLLDLTIIACAALIAIVKKENFIEVLGSFVE